jgi:hypothetical protein
MHLQAVEDQQSRKYPQGQDKVQQREIVHVAQRNHDNGAQIVDDR